MLQDRLHGASFRFATPRGALPAIALTTLLAACGGSDEMPLTDGGDATPTTIFVPTTSGTTGATVSTTTFTPVTTGGTTAGTTVTPVTTGGTTAGTTFTPVTTGGAMADGGTPNTTGTTGTTSGPSTPGAVEPIIPEVTGDCPSFQSGSFNFSGLSGVMEVGSKGDGSGSLLFYWHGTGQQASMFNGLFGGIGSGNVRKITSQGGIIFSVQGSTGGGDASCSGTAVFDGDFSVIDQVVACAVRDHNIDPRRIYATGCSAGGLQSGCMATRRADYVAAVAPNSGGLVGSFGASFMGSTGHIPPAMNMHGGSGDNVIINFGESSATFNNAITSKGGLAIDCNHMSGHCGAPGDLYDAAIDFLLAHPFGVDPEPYASGLPANFPSYCEIK